MTAKNTEEIRKKLGEKKLIIGAERTLKNLKQGKLEKVYVASNCPEDIKKELENHCEIGKAELVELDQSNEKVGVICRKPFTISVLGQLKV